MLLLHSQTRLIKSYVRAHKSSSTLGGVTRFFERAYTKLVRKLRVLARKVLGRS